MAEEIRYICKNQNCDNLCAKGRRECSKCRDKKHKQNNPSAYTYNQTKQRAKQRGIKFTLTFKQWNKIVKKYNYLELKGTSPDSMSLERKDPLRGYEDGNVTVIPLGQNGLKGATEDRKRIWQHKSYSPREENDPF